MAHKPEAGLTAMNAVIRRADGEDAWRRDPVAFMGQYGLAAGDVDTIAAAGPERMLVYRALVHNRMRNAIREFLPRTTARRGRAAFGVDFAAFMAEQASRSPYLRDVPREFVAWAEPRWRADATAVPFLADLARHELLETDVLNDPRGGEPPTGSGLELEAAVVFDGSARLLTYDWAVHKLSYDIADREAPAPGTVRVLVFRDARNKVRYFELKPWAAALVHVLLVERLSLRAGLERAAQDLGEPLDDDSLARSAALLAELAEFGVLLGGG